MALYSVSICTGVGGLDLGIELACPGVFTPIAVSEGEAYAAAILAARMEDKTLAACPIWSDVRTLCDAKFSAYVRERTGGQGIDFLYGGIPCQPHSVAGKQLGELDPRDLWPDTVRILAKYKPWLFLMENVPGMLGDVSRRAIVDLQQLGYIVPRPVLLEAAAVGSPQRRERLFLLAYSGLQHKHAQQRRARRESARSGSELADAGCKPAQGQHSNRAVSRPVDGSDGALAIASDNGRRNACGQTDGGGRDRAEDRPSDVSERCERREDQSDAIACPANCDHCAAMAESSSGRGRKRKPGRGSDRRAASVEASGATCTMGNANGAKRRADRCEDGGRPRGEGERHRTSGDDVGDSIGAIRCERLLISGEDGRTPCEDAGPQAEHSARAGGTIPYWPPGPADRAEWERIIAIRPDLAPATQPRLRSLVDGLPAGMGESASTRVDELRALGNAVVPACGAVAFLILLDRLKEVSRQ